VDTWLWATRQTRSRSQATAAARAGHVRVNGATAKASQQVRVGDEVRLRVEGFDRVLEVAGLVIKRVGAPQARLCAVDRTPPRPRIGGAAPIRDRGAGRPSKRERRELDRLRGRDSHEHS
jgi:ribosome-associated heat shock protein Hsp15